MIYCFDIDLNFEYSKNEMIVARKNKNGLLYDSSLKEFFDFYGNKIDINGRLLFPRTGVLSIYDMNDAIIKHGGKIIATNDEIEMVYSWPTYYKTNRKIEILKGKDLIDPITISRIENNYGNEVFFKTKNKNFNDVISINLLKEPNCAFYKTLQHHLEDEFIISEKMNITKDKYGEKEYRCFVIDGCLMNISRKTTRILHTIEPKALEAIQSIIERVDSNFPKYYCVDICEYEKDGKKDFDVIEFNPIHASGLYLYNSILNKSDDLTHNNPKKIAMEFMDIIDECVTDGKINLDSGNKYDIMGSFASDLRSICINGDIGLQFTNIVIDSSDYARCEAIFKDIFKVSIESDEQLRTESLPLDEAVAKFNKLVKKNKNH